MRDMSSAHVARTGSGLGITPANSGGVATQQRAPGHERPSAAQRVAGHGRLSAASTAPGSDVPRAITVRAPGHDCQSAAPRAPGPDVPLATTARVPRHDRLSAAHPAPDHNRSGATLAAVSVPDHSPVSPPSASGHGPLPSWTRRRRLTVSLRHPSRRPRSRPCKTVPIRHNPRPSFPLARESTPSLWERVGVRATPTSKNKKGALPMIAEWLIVPVSIALGLLAAWIEHSRLRRTP